MLSSWMDARGIPVSDAFAVTLVTDGVRTDENHLMCVCLGQYPECSPLEIWLEGARPAVNMHFTGISDELYDKQAKVSREQAACELETMRAEHPGMFLVGYNAAFTQRWLQAYDLPALPVFDLGSYLKAMEIWGFLPEDLQTIPSLISRINAAVAGRGKIPSLNQMINTYLREFWEQDDEILPHLQKLALVQQLFTVCLALEGN